MWTIVTTAIGSGNSALAPASGLVQQVSDNAQLL